MKGPIKSNRFSGKVHVPTMKRGSVNCDGCLLAGDFI